MERSFVLLDMEPLKEFVVREFPHTRIFNGPAYHL